VARVCVLGARFFRLLAGGEEAAELEEQVRATSIPAWHFSGVAAIAMEIRWKPLAEEDLEAPYDHIGQEDENGEKRYSSERNYSRSKGGELQRA